MRILSTGLLLLLSTFALGQSNLNNAEYFIDIDPGYGNGTSISLSGSSAIINESITNDLTQGIHTVYLRVKDKNSVWGMAEAVTVLVIEPYVVPETYQLAEAEYFFNTDPGYGQGDKITVATGWGATISELITNGLPAGINTLFLRVKNVDGTWGMAQASSFLVQEDYTATIPPPNPIIGMEYFFDVDPGVGLGTYVAIPEKDTVLIDELLDALQITEGMHKIGVRVQSKSGAWSLWDWQDFEVEKNPCDDFAVVLTNSENNKCHGESLGSIDISISGGSENYAYTWSNSAITEDLSELAVGIYSVIVTDNDLSCIGTLEVEITEPPDIEITATTTDVIAGNDGAADVTVIGGTGAYTYHWDSGQDTEDLNGVSAGEYTIDVTDENACEVSKTFLILDIITGIDKEDENGLFLFPNPASKYVHIQMSLKKTMPCTLRMVNNNGKIVMEKKFENRSILGDEINVSQLKTGLYVVIVNYEDGNSIKKLSISK